MLSLLSLYERIFRYLPSSLPYIGHEIRVSFKGRDLGDKVRGWEKGGGGEYLSCEDGVILEKNYGLLSPYRSDPGAFNFIQDSGGYAGQGPC